MNEINKIADTKIESVVLGGLMTCFGGVERVSSKLKSEVFSKWENREIYKAIISLHNQDKPIDMLSVMDCLRGMGVIGENKITAYYVASTSQASSSLYNLNNHCDILIKYYTKRELNFICNNSIERLQKDENDIFEVKAQMQTKIMNLSNMQISDNESIFDTEFASEYYNEIGNEISDFQKGVINGVQIGINSADKHIKSFKDGDLIIWAARPGMGKTALVTSLVSHNGELGKEGVFFSLEMSKKKLADRFVSFVGSVPLEFLADRDNNTVDYLDKIQVALNKIIGYNLTIDDTPSINLNHIENSLYRMNENLKSVGKRVRYVIIDYLQLMSGNEKTNNREQEISKISRGLKEIAKKFNIPVIALSQLSRAVEQRGGYKKPQLSDLRESGAIEQDADMICFVWRPEYYGIKEDEYGESYEDGHTEFVVAKNRNGKTMRVVMKFEAEFTRFTDFKTDNPFQEQLKMKPNDEFQDEFEEEKFH